MRSKRILSALLAVVMVVMFAVPVSAAETSEVYADLTASMLDGKKFDSADYPKNTADHNVYLLTVNERGYNTKDMSKYGFFVYLYNPSGSALNVSSTNNRIQLATAWDAESQLATAFGKFNLEFVSVSSEEGLEYVYYKFKVGTEVNGTKGIQDYVAPLGRFYEVSGFEVQKMSVTNAIETEVGIRYAYYGTEAAANKTCKASAIDTIALDVHHTYFRTESSANGVNHQNQLNAVYFNVPANYWTNYDFLYAIEAYWEEYRTTPMIVSESQSLISYLTTWRGRSNGDGYNRSNPVSLHTDPRSSNATGVFTMEYDWTYNTDLSDSVTLTRYSLNNCTTLSWAFHSNDIALRKADIPVDTVLKQWKSNQAEHRDTMITEKGVDYYFDRTAGPQVHKIRFDETFTMESYASNHSWLQRLWNYNIFNGGAGTNLKDDYSGILAIEEVALSDTALSAEALAKRYFVNPGDADAFKAVVDAGKASNMKTIVFRFAVTDYFAEEITAMINGTVLSETTYRAEQTVFLDFDIISLTFQKEQSHYVIPVSYSPTDFIGGIDSPQVDADASLGTAVDTVKDMFSELTGAQMFLKLFGMMMGLLVILLAAYLIVGLIRPRNPVIVKINDTASKITHRKKKNPKGGNRK